MSSNVLMNRFSIRDIQNLTGIKAHTLRIWEQRHRVIVPKRTETNIRYYDANDLKTALRVALLNQHGYKISRIQKMSEDDIDTLLKETVDEDFQFGHQLNKLVVSTVDMNVQQFEHQIDKYIYKYGLDATIERLLFAFMEKIGVLWMTNQLFPAQEHLISNVIIRKLLLATEEVHSKPDLSKPKYLLFLPESEFHEIGLLYMHFQLAKLNKNVIYLGANSPLDQIELVSKTLKPEYHYTHITAASNDFDIEKYMHKLSNLTTTKQIYFSGSMAQRNKVVNLPSNITFLSSLAEAKDTLLRP